MSVLDNYFRSRHEAHMPLYSYQCPSGHNFDVIRSVGERDLPIFCPLPDATLSTELQAVVACNYPAVRVPTLNAKSFPGADSWRK